jgi:hypothetical protein
MAIRFARDLYQEHAKISSVGVWWWGAEKKHYYVLSSDSDDD